MSPWQSLLPVTSGKWAGWLNWISFWFWREVKILTLECHQQSPPAQLERAASRNPWPWKSGWSKRISPKVGGFLSDTIHRSVTWEYPKEAHRRELPHPTGNIDWSELRQILPKPTYIFLEFLGNSCLLLSLVSDKPDGNSELMITFWGWNATSGVDRHSWQTDQSLGGTDYYHLFLLLLIHLELFYFFFLWK